ncbi:hypothetical protein MPL3356_60556 [Mesorhizobium plurifarium]|uniref:Uncharacterized protein n=1 Tax=Mesorhizobium plurifarium TaxID=69974 RepID=A0A090EFA0_MESPL|nr:hypothetical protein MPL3356_60556 [Mesorhizobium plurifarium]
MLKLLARIEPDREYARHGYEQVAVYRSLSELPVAVYPFFFESMPIRGQKLIHRDGFTYELEWLPDLIGPPVPVAALRLRALHRRAA